MKYITMNKKELEQAKIFAAVLNGSITQVEAAARLRMTTRWVNAKIKRFRHFAEFGLIHKSRGKKSKNRLDEPTRQLIISLAKEEWHGFKPTFMAEKLEEFYQIKISKETIRKTLADDQGLSSMGSSRRIFISYPDRSNRLNDVTQYR